ncbi:uncharacterized protein TNCV_714931 [Trichonephila clavipes]|nr:uncharacterized protein TNCV_714931 [Trichonephila clavipes]
MSPWPVISPDLSSIEYVWDIIGRQLQHHPQPSLTVPVLTQQALNSLLQSDIQNLYNKIHACFHTCIEITGGYTSC